MTVDWSLTFGIAAAALCFSQLLYPLRRALMARPFGTAARALQFHIYGSALMFVLVLAHAGLRWPAGWLGRAMLALSAWAVVSGAAGLAIQRIVPRTLLRLDVDPGRAVARRHVERLLRVWPVFHVPPALALVGLLVWHIAAVVYF